MITNVRNCSCNCSCYITSNTLPVKLPINVEATKLLEPIVHLSFDSSQRRVTFASSPLSISIPAFSEAEPVAFEFKTIVLSSTVNVSVDNIV